MTERQIALKCGVSPQAVSKWVVGKARPDERARKRLEKATGIPGVAWDQEAVVVPSDAANDASTDPEAA